MTTSTLPAHAANGFAKGQANGTHRAAPVLSFAQARKMGRTHPLNVSEIPDEHAVSLPIPTRRANVAAYAFFAAPSAPIAGQPPQQGAPDRWWLLDAESAAGRLLFYALCSVAPFADASHSAAWKNTTLPPITLSMAQYESALAQLDTQMDALAASFWAGDAGEPGARQALGETLNELVPAPLLPRYQALAPDFWAWLAA